MDFRFTDEQQMMADTVRGLLAETCRPVDLRRLMASGAARDAARWSALVELGLGGALVPENAGGFGLTAADFVLVAEACGHAALPEPLVEHAGVALPLLAALARDRRSATILDRALAGEITIAVAHSANPFVADADTAGAVLCLRDGDVHLCDADSVSLVPQPSADPFRRLFTLADRPCPTTAIATAAEASAALDAALDHGALFAAAQLVGIAQRAVELAVAYAGERSQFGKPIGSYQAVKHLVATAQVKIEFARPVVYAAAAEAHHGDAYSRARISHAKLAAAEAADLACRTAVQVHGAMGYSWEVDVHFFLKRALALASWWGDRRFHLDRVGRRAFDLPLGADRTFAREHDHA